MNNHLSPHDRFFRSAMANSKVAQEFFTIHLPDKIKNIVDFNSIQLQKDSFINDNLKQNVTDLLFSAKFNLTTGYFYLLIEHQSTPQKLMPLRILKYVIGVFELHLKTTKSKKLPIVYPMLFYNGRASYNYSTDIFDLFEDDKKIAQEIFLKPFQLIDLTKLSDKNFASMLYYGVLAKTMKHIFANDFLLKLRELIYDLKQIENQGDLDYIYSIISYIILAGEIKSKEAFHDIIKTGLIKVDEEQIMTLAEIYRQEGRQEGKQAGLQEGEKKGRQEGRQEAICSVITSLIQQGFSIEKIAKYINLSVAEVKRLKEPLH